MASGLDWATAENSQAEGLVLLRNGHVLVAKEKDPPLLMEFGSADDIAEGMDPGLLFSTSARFPLPQGGHAEFELLKLWKT